MAQTTAQKEKAIRFGSWVLKLEGVNIGLLDDAKLVVEYNVIQIKAHNGYLPPKKKPSSVKLTASIYEIDPANLTKVDGGWVQSSFAGTAVNVVAEPIANRVVGAPVRLANATHTWVINTSIVVKANGSTLVAGTAYRSFVLNWYTYIEPLQSNANAITVDYTYTPASKTRYTISDVAKALEMYEVVFENTDENGKKFSITIPKGNASGNLELWFVSDDATDEVMKLPIEFTANPDDTNVLVYIDDAQTA